MPPWVRRCTEIFKMATCWPASGPAAAWAGAMGMATCSCCSSGYETTTGRPHVCSAALPAALTLKASCGNPAA